MFPFSEPKMISSNRSHWDKHRAKLGVVCFAARTFCPRLTYLKLRLELLNFKQSIRRSSFTLDKNQSRAINTTNLAFVKKESIMKTISEIHNMLGVTVGCPVKRQLVFMANHRDLPASATAQKVFSNSVESIENKDTIYFGSCCWKPPQLLCAVSVLASAGSVFSASPAFSTP